MNKNEVIVMDRSDIHFEEFYYARLFSNLYNGKMVIGKYSDGRPVTVMKYDKEAGVLLDYSMSQNTMDPDTLTFKLEGKRRANLDEFFAFCVAWASVLKEWSVVVGWPE